MGRPTATYLQHCSSLLLSYLVQGVCQELAGNAVKVGSEVKVVWCNDRRIGLQQPSAQPLGRNVNSPLLLYALALLQ